MFSISVLNAICNHIENGKLLKEKFWPFSMTSKNRFNFLITHLLLTFINKEILFFKNI